MSLPFRPLREIQRVEEQRFQPRDPDEPCDICGRAWADHYHDTQGCPPESSDAGRTDKPTTSTAGGHDA